MKKKLLIIIRKSFLFLTLFLLNLYNSQNFNTKKIFGLQGEVKKVKVEKITPNFDAVLKDEKTLYFDNYGNLLATTSYLKYSKDNKIGEIRNKTEFHNDRSGSYSIHYNNLNKVEDSTVYHFLNKSSYSTTQHNFENNEIIKSVYELNNDGREVSCNINSSDENSDTNNGHIETTYLNNYPKKSVYYFKDNNFEENYEISDFDDLGNYKKVLTRTKFLNDDSQDIYENTKNRQIIYYNDYNSQLSDYDIKDVEKFRKTQFYNIYSAIKLNIDNWFKKDEFEKDSDYKFRINNQFNEAFKLICKQIFEEKIKKIKNYHEGNLNLKILEYNSENEEFLVQVMQKDNVGDTIYLNGFLNIPIKEAKNFKERYENGLINFHLDNSQWGFFGNTVVSF